MWVVILTVGVWVRIPLGSPNLTNQLVTGRYLPITE